MTTAALRLGLALTTAALLSLTPGVPGPALAAELEARTSQAYDAYLERATRAFVSRAAIFGRVEAGRDGTLSAGPAEQDGIMKLPGGLVHHWVATAFVRGRTVDDLLQLSQTYSNYPSVYRAVMAIDVLERSGDTYRVRTRVKGSGGGLTAVLEIRSTIRYSFPTGDRAQIFTNADEIREVKNAGTRDERLLPVGNDSGYLWRANTFTRLVAQDGGVYIEMETLGLSRAFPTLLGWLIEPIARRIGRRSVEATLDEFVTASAAWRTP